MNLFFKFFGFLTFFSLIFTEIYIKRGYEDENSFKDWKKSGKNPSHGDLILSKPKHLTDDSKKSLFTEKPNSYYNYLLGLSKPVSNIGKDLVFQFALTHEVQNTCGGGYLKLLTENDPKTFDSETPYAIMFGPDHCGSSSRIHLIFNINGNNILKTNDIPYTVDKESHLYTLVVHPNQTYQVFVDCKSVDQGKISENWDYLLPKEIDDPNDKKPIDWVDEAEIDDPNDKKPENWVDEEFVIDEESKAPEDWNTEIDGEFKPNKKKNPDYKGPWKPKQIPNPDYKGEWKQKKMPNPDYKELEGVAQYESIKGIGYDVWMVDAKSYLSHVMLSDNVEEVMKECKAALEDFEEYNKIIKKIEDEEEKKRQKEMEEQMKKTKDEKGESSSETEKEEDEEGEDSKSGPGGDEL